jgi:hypothetical protein
MSKNFKDIQASDLDETTMKAIFYNLHGEILYKIIMACNESISAINSDRQNQILVSVIKHATQMYLDYFLVPSDIAAIARNFNIKRTEN